jgi:hypothetical protein
MRFYKSRIRHRRLPLNQQPKGLRDANNRRSLEAHIKKQVWTLTSDGFHGLSVTVQYMSSYTVRGATMHAVQTRLKWDVETQSYLPGFLSLTVLSRTPFTLSIELENGTNTTYESHDRSRNLNFWRNESAPSDWQVDDYLSAAFPDGIPEDKYSDLFRRE